jgi:DNA-directed RNA polymerase specialized sigma24 family protein
MVVRENPSNTRDVFITLCSEDFIRACLGKTCDSSQVQVVRCIVLRNILNGRVTRQWNSQPSKCATNWLHTYAQGVYSHYQAEHVYWLHLQDKSGQLELYNLLVKHADDYAAGLGKSEGGIDAIELAHEAFITSTERLRRYPFDLSLEMWLDRHVRQCSERLTRAGNIALLSDEEVDGLADQSRNADSLMWDEWIDLAHGVDKLSPANRVVLFMWYLGFTLHETSSKLNLSVKAISNRRGRIQKQLSAL